MSAPKIKTVIFRRAVSESVVARMVACMFGVAGSDRWHEVAHRVDDSDKSSCLPWSLSDTRLYTWAEDVSRIMFECDARSELVAALVASPSSVFLVKDDRIASRNGLWLMVADGAGNQDNDPGYAVAHAPVCMLVNHTTVADSTYTITAVQLISCLRKK
jgi:hypothetical protein